MKDKYFALTNLGVEGQVLDVFDTKDELQEFLKNRGNIKDLIIIEGRRIIPEYKFYYSLTKEE